MLYEFTYEAVARLSTAHQVWQHKTIAA